MAAGTGKPDKTPKSSIWVVEDDPAMRRILGIRLKDAAGQVSFFESGEAMLDDVDGLDGPACLVLDIRLPGMNGIEIQGELARRGFIMPIVFITSDADVPMAVAGMRAGAFDFIEKPLDYNQLKRRIGEAIEHHRKQLEPSSLRRLTTEKLGSLTPREHQVLRQLVAGHQTKTIAANLGISVRTAELHRARVMQKSGAGSLSVLVRMAIDAGISAD